MSRILLLPFVFLFAVQSPRAGAQSSSLGDTIRIVRIDTSAFPLVRVHVRVFCNGLQYSGLSMVDIEVEDGEIIKNFTLSCPSTTVPISAALVLDRSSSVSGTSMYRIQEGAWRFVELMQKHAAGVDEAAIISFGSDVTVDQSMTPDQSLLFDAIERLYAWGNTAMFDAVMFGIHEAAAYASNPIRAVVLLSDGEDNVSSTDLLDVIDYARREGIPVYTLCLTYHANPEAVAVMRTLAEATGGKFFPLSHPDDIIPAFNAIASILSGGANDCIVQYRIDCPDGSVRTVKVTAKACGKTVTATARYKSPVDPNMPAVVVHFDSAEVFENGDLFIPVRVSAVGSEAEITRLAFGISRLDSIEYVESLTAGYFAEPFTLAAWRGGDTLHFRLDGGRTLTGTDTLMILHFRVRTFAKDSVLAFLVYSLEKNTVQCMLLKLDLQRFSVRKRPRVSAACGDAIDVKWNRAEARYEPAEATLSATIVNTGTIRARNTRAWISLPYGVQLVSGRDTVYLNNSLLEPNASETILFRVRFTPTDTAKTYDICITVQPDSGLAVVCCTRVSIEQARPALRCSLTLPAEIHWSDSTGSYEPPEFPVTLTVRNLGPLAAREVEVWMDPPSGFAPYPDPPLRTMLVPSRLAAADTGSVTWVLRPLERLDAETLTIWVRAAAGGDTALCSGNVFVGSAPVRAAVMCADPRVLVFDEEKGTVEPQAFIASVRVRNISGVDMAQARGIITLPPFLALAPGETNVKNFPGGAVLHPGDSATLTWAVMTAGKPVDGAQICMDILASNYRGGRCCIPLVVRTNESAPLLRCSLTGPDTVHYRNGRYDPDPFVLDLRVENIGASPAKTVYAALLQGADLSIDSSDTALKMIADSLAASASTVAQFRLRATERPVSRFDTIRVSVYAANGGAIMCEWVVWIEAVRRPRMAVACTAPQELRFSDSSNAYVPSPFTFSLTARNVGNAPADSVVAEILLPPDMTLAPGEQAAKLLSPSTLDPGESGVAAWAVVAVPRPSPRTDTVRALVRVGGKTAAGVEGCGTVLFIPARRSAALDIRCMPASPLTVSGDSYVPDPFAVRLLVRNGGDADAYDLTAEIVSYGRLARVTGDSTVKIRPTLKAGGGETEFTWYFSARPAAVQDSAVVCIRVAARFLGESICCTTIHLPPLGGSGFTVSCSAPDTVRFDTIRGSYPNPVTVTAAVTNTGAVAIDSLRATINLPVGLRLAAGESPDRFIPRLETGRVENVSWLVDVLRDTATTPVLRLVRIQLFAGAYRDCETGILVFPPPPGRDTAVMAVRCTAPDTIRYINERIGYQPSPFTVSVDIANNGTTTFPSVQATLTLPAGVTFAPGESATKTLPSPLTPGRQGSIAWSCVPSATETTITVRFDVRVEVEGLPAASCSSASVVGRIRRLVVLSIPKGNVIRSGKNIFVPVSYGHAPGALVSAFGFDILYDAATVRIEGLEKAGTLTEHWPSLVLDQPEAGRVRITGMAGEPLTGSGTLALLNVFAVSGDGSDNRFGWKYSELLLADPAFPEGIDVELQHGDIVTSGDCLVPLAGSERFIAPTARPNPFRETTTVSFRLERGDEEGTIVVDVLDTFGRIVRRLVEGRFTAGEYATRLEAHDLPAGVYFCRLIGDAGVRVGLLVKSR